MVKRKPLAFAILGLCLSTSIFAQQENMPVNNQLSINLTRLAIYQSAEILLCIKTNPNHSLRAEATYKPAYGNHFVQQTNILFFGISNFRQVSNIYSIALGIEEYDFQKKRKNYFSVDAFYEHQYYNKVIWDNGSGMSMDHVNKLQSETHDVYGFRFLSGRKFMLPSAESCQKLLLDFYTGVSVGIGFSQTKLYGIQNSNDPWKNYDPPLTTHDKIFSFGLHLGVRIGLGWSEKN
ncbi:MAG: hypothetical protein WCO63_01460 [Bacteroidota bacterium]